VNTSILAQELEPLHAGIGQAGDRLKLVEDELRVLDAELAAFSAEQQRYDALREVCKALDTLKELEAGELFWGEVVEIEDAARHTARLWETIGRFEGEIQGLQDSRASVKAQIEQCLDELYDLHEEVRQAHAREERRQEEFIVEREVSAVPYRPMLMPWAYDSESERTFRRALGVALLWSFFLAALVVMVKVPLPARGVVVEIPERLATLVKKETPRPEPAREVKKPERPQEEEKPTQPEKKEQKPVKEETKVAAAPSKQAARTKAENTGVLAFKSSFADLMEDTPVAKLGTEARLSKEAPQAAGQSQASRSLVAMQAQGASGGIGSGAISRNIGGAGAGGGNGNGNRIGGVGFARVESSVAGLAEEKGRPLSGGPGPSRTDEEIQIVFDRYKATLYRIYNTELRKDPTLRGKILLRLTIEPGGEVSMCKAESTDLASPELVANIIERVKKFNFGPKEDVPKTTILYPIDFLPAG
jgi:outer membrane biosynthesis protein TonB/prefoldin subunit 5